MNIFDEFLTLAKSLQANNCQYCLIGGVAMAFHDLPRFTKDIDLLTNSADFSKIKNTLESCGYFESTKPWTFNNTPLTLHRFFKPNTGDESMIIDLMVSGEARHQQIISNALMAEYNELHIPIATKPDLIWLKRFRNSPQDKVDIEKLSHE